MTGVEVIARLHRHRGWVNAQLMDAAQALPDESLHQTFPIGQGTVWKSLLHMYAAEYVWLKTLLGDENPVLAGDVVGKIPGNQEGTGGIASLAELISQWKTLDTEWQAYVASLADQQLNDRVPKYSSFTQMRFVTLRGDILLHVCTHAHYTTAQVINMLRQLGGPKLDPMLITLARQQGL